MFSAVLNSISRSLFHTITTVGHFDNQSQCNWSFIDSLCDVLRFLLDLHDAHSTSHFDFDQFLSYLLKQQTKIGAETAGLRNDGQNHHHQRRFLVRLLQPRP